MDMLETYHCHGHPLGVVLGKVPSVLHERGAEVEEDRDSNGEHGLKNRPAPVRVSLRV
jgi:hypothetical protein